MVWERKAVVGDRGGLGDKGGPGDRGDQAIGVGWATRGVQEIVAAKVWEIEVLAWVTVGVRGRELELAQAIVEGPVAVGEGVPSKAPVAEAVMRVAPAPAVPQAVAVVRVGERPCRRWWWRPRRRWWRSWWWWRWRSAPVKGCRDLSAVFRMFARRERRCATQAETRKIF